MAAAAIVDAAPVVAMAGVQAPGDAALGADFAPPDLHGKRVSCFKRHVMHVQETADCRHRRILCYGDSNTAGFCAGGRNFVPYGHSLSKGLAAVGSPCEVSLCGLNGLCGDELAAKLDSPAIKDTCGFFGKGLARIMSEEGHQDLVIIMVGTNDLGKGASPESIMPHVRTLHAACHDQRVPTIALAPPVILSGPSRIARPRFARLLADFKNATQGVVGFFDVETMCSRSAWSGFWESDQLHFSPAGSRELGRLLAPKVSKLLCAGGASAWSETSLTPPMGNAPSYTVGAVLEFFSHSLGMWIPCKVTAVEATGAVQLDVKPGALIGRAEQAQRLRAPRMAALRTGQQLEYYSTTVGKWIPCKIMRVDASGAVELDVKQGYAMGKGEQAQRLRHQGAADRD